MVQLHPAQQLAQTLHHNARDNEKEHVAKHVGRQAARKDRLAGPDNGQQRKDTPQATEQLAAAKNYK